MSEESGGDTCVLIENRHERSLSRHPGWPSRRQTTIEMKSYDLYQNGGSPTTGAPQLRKTVTNVKSGTPIEKAVLRHHTSHNVWTSALGRLDLTVPRDHHQPPRLVPARMLPNTEIPEWTAEYIEAAWTDIMIGEATEEAMKATFSKYAAPSVQWSVDGNILGFDELVKYCCQLRARMQSADVKVHDLVVEQGNEGNLKQANRHITRFVRRDGSTVSNECFQIIDIDENGLISKAVESARNFDDSSVPEGGNR